MALPSATLSTLRSPRLTLLLSMLLAVAAAASVDVANPSDEESKPKTPSLLRSSKKNSNNNGNNNGHNNRSRGLIVSRRRQPKIIGGDPIGDPNRYPYFALMDGRSFCGAVLVSRRFVLTAAHCVGADDDFEVGISSKDDLSDGGDGILSLFDSWLNGRSGSGRNGEDDVVDYPYKAKRVHPDYDDDSLDADLALYELDRDVDADLIPIKLEKGAITMPGTELTAIGFGDTNPSNWIDTVSNTLREVTLFHVPLADCRQDFGSSDFGLTEGMLCAFDAGEDTCQGDSGGPLLLKGETPENDALVGLVSWGIDCGGSLPGVYTRISRYYDWINQEMCALNSAAVPAYMDCTGYETDVVGSGSGSGGGPPAGGEDDDEDDDDLFGADLGLDEFLGGDGDDDDDGFGSDDGDDDLFGAGFGLDDLWNNIDDDGFDDNLGFDDDGFGDDVFDDDDDFLGAGFGLDGILGGDDDIDDAWWTTDDGSGGDSSGGSILGQVIDTVAGWFGF